MCPWTEHRNAALVAISSFVMHSPKPAASGILHIRDGCQACLAWGLVVVVLHFQSRDMQRPLSQVRSYLVLWLLALVLDV